MCYNFQIDAKGYKLSNYESLLSKFSNWKKYKREIKINQVLEQNKKIELNIEIDNNPFVLYVSFLDFEKKTTGASAVINKMTYIIQNDEIIELNIEVNPLTTSWGKILSNLLKEGVQVVMCQNVSALSQVTNFYFERRN
jgi:hypothetical protein